MTGKAIQIKIDACFNPFQQSFNRVGYFSCINENITLDSLPNEWVIKNEKGLGYAMPTPSKDDRQHILQGYKHFIQCYLVRDCVESFAVSLDNLFLHMMINGKTIQANGTVKLEESEKELLNQFQNVGLSAKEGKIQLLKTHFNLELSRDYKDIINSLKEIRNCFSHSNGFVRNIDGKKDGKAKRKFSWATFHIFAIDGESGKEFDIDIGESGQQVKAGTQICGQLKLKDHSKSFKIGEQLSFTAYETYEIAFSLQLISKQYLKEVANILSANKS